MQMAKQIAKLTALYIVLWWILTEGAQAWWVGLPAVLAAALLAQRLHRPDTMAFKWRQVPLFFLFFVYQSVRAGVDVAAHTLRPTPRIHPGTLYYDTALPAGTVRYLFGAIVGLFPGTLCAEFRQRQLVLHVLDTEVDVAISCRQLERRISRLFGLPVASPIDGSVTDTTEAH